jgi:methyl-accepting chemotaxis protein
MRWLKSFFGSTDEAQRQADRLALQDLKGQVAAINKSQGVIEFELDGTIISANDNFLAVVGYLLDEVRGQHHRVFVDPAFRNSPEYKAFWQKLGQGQFDAGQYKRIAKNGREVWLQATYNPICDAEGKPFKVVKFAVDITAAKLKEADTSGQIAAIHKSQGVIEFSLDGTIQTANTNFLDAVGYSLEEVRGKHHSLFVDPVFARTTEYQQFWEKLGRGEYEAGEYRRIGKNGKEVWLQASYNPILDMNGKPFKVVKYAADITGQKLAAIRLHEAVEQVRGVVDAVKEQDLTRRVPLEGKSGEIAELCRGVNFLVDDMVQVLSTIHEAAGAISTAAREIASGNSDLSSRTEQQASSLEETAASMEELNTTVKQNSESARLANQMAQNASEIALRGGSVVDEVVGTMQAISESSKKIVDIISVIDSIAFQTNILALNAAVEAARAGEQGRGFAVVATEVRNLAQRSANAAKEIKNLIGESVQNVESGSRMVDQAGSTMGEIVSSIKHVSEIMAEISSATVEQSAGINQVNQAITQMEETTQKNAALVEESAAAAESMSEQAHNLNHTVSQFKIAEGRVERRSNMAQLAALRKSNLPAAAPRRNPPKAVQAQYAANADEEWAEF